MGILTGAMTVRRFRVDGELPADWRSTFGQALGDHAFPETPTPRGGEEVEGWVLVGDLLANRFDDLNRWQFDDWLVFALRVDKKRLPAKLFTATLNRRCEAWCAERGTESCPASVRTELKDALEDEWYARALPTVAVTEAAWELSTGTVWLHSLSDSVADRFRKRFLRTFGRTLIPWSPLDFLDSAGEVERLMATAPGELGGAS